MLTDPGCFLTGIAWQKTVGEKCLSHHNKRKNASIFSLIMPSLLLSLRKLTLARVSKRLRLFDLIQSHSVRLPEIYSAFLPCASHNLPVFLPEYEALKRYIRTHFCRLYRRVFSGTEVIHFLSGDRSPDPR